MNLDRRRKRSTYKALSLHYWLASVADQTPALALVLADPTGLLVAASIRGPEAEELAAVAPLLSRRETNGETAATSYGVPMVIDEMKIDGAPLLLCVVGEKAVCAPVLREAADGVERILNN